MLAKLWALLASRSIMTYVYAGAAIAVTGFIVWGSHAIYDAGYEKAEARYQAEIAKAQAEAVAEARAAWEKTAVVGEQQVRVEERIVEKVRVVTREIPKIIERTITPECRDLGPDILRLYNAAIGGDEGGSATTPAEPAG